MEATANQETANNTNEQTTNTVNTHEHNEVVNTAENADTSNTDSNNDTSESGEALLKQELAIANDKYIRLYSEFDNYRRRTAKEKIDLMSNAGEDFFKMMLPVVDDFERALKSINEASDVEALKQGVDLIYNKFKNTLTAKGLKEMNSLEQVFDADIHEAITQIPAPTEALKGKVVDELEKGYYLNEKVIRYAKVVVGN